MTKSGGHGGLFVVNAPRSYDRLPQQEKFKKAIEFCGIKKGMKKTELMTAMKDCLPQYFKDAKDQKHDGEREKEEDYALQPR